MHEREDQHKPMLVQDPVLNDVVFVSKLVNLKAIAFGSSVVEAIHAGFFIENVHAVVQPGELLLDCLFRNVLLPNVTDLGSDIRYD